ncbi:MAG: hypothetical protein Q9191_002169 [Dirinaria sp. TL-2023a]
MPSTSFEERCEIIQRLLEGLPLHHVVALEFFLEKCTFQEIWCILTRLINLPGECFPVLMETLKNASTEKFYCYLGVFIATPAYQYCSSNVYSCSGVVGEGSIDDVDERIRSGKSFTGTESFSSIMDDAERILDSSEGVKSSIETEQRKIQVQIDGSSVITCEKDVNHRAEQCLATPTTEETSKEPDDHLDGTNISSAVSLRESLFGVRSVPQEIYDMLVEELFTAVYVPGVIIPSQYPDFDGHDYFADIEFCAEKSMVLHDVHPRLYEKYKERYWTQNTWQIQYGDSSYTLDFLNLLPPEKYLQIQTVELAFSIDDSDLTDSYFYEYEPGLNLIENIEKYNEEIRIISRDLDDIWFWKFETICGLRLKKLTLDFTNAYSVEGEFLGLEVAQTFHSFTYEKPELTIIAPTEELEAKLVRLFADLND